MITIQKVNKMDEYINQFDNLSAEQIVDLIIIGRGISFDNVRRVAAERYLDFGHEKQTKVKQYYDDRDIETYNKCLSNEDLERYIKIFPEGNYVNKAKERINEFLLRREKIDKIIKDINGYTPSEILGRDGGGSVKLSDEDLNDLCNEIGIEASIVKNYKSPILKFDDVPEKESDIPSDFTDVFFWGIPSSGKTCALAAILNTMKNEYTVKSPEIKRKLGTKYRDSLTNIFKTKYNEIGYLPEVGTSIDNTQYMPFLLTERGENKMRKISFFELSGELFKYFYEVSNYSKLDLDADKRELINSSFATLELLLKSNNQKIHFFFIDYNQETKHSVDEVGLTQSNYLEAAKSYFEDNDKILQKKTDAIYVVITKSDELTNNKNDNPEKFLKDNFGSFIDVLEHQCKDNSIKFKIKLFSIGKVFFKRICKIDRSYSREIIEDLLEKIRPISRWGFMKRLKS